MSQPKTLKLEEVVNLGLVQEINRRLLHPRGLALAYFTEDDAMQDAKFPVQIIDSRDDPEGFCFAEDPDMPLEVMWEKEANFEALLSRDKAELRKKMFGEVVQPLSNLPKLENTEK